MLKGKASHVEEVLRIVDGYEEASGRSEQGDEIAYNIMRGDMMIAVSRAILLQET